MAKRRICTLSALTGFHIRGTSTDQCGAKAASKEALTVPVSNMGTFTPTPKYCAEARCGQSASRQRPESRSQSLFFITDELTDKRKTRRRASIPGGSVNYCPRSIVCVTGVSQSATVIVALTSCPVSPANDTATR